MTATYQPQSFSRSAAIALAWALSTALALVLSRLAIDAMPYEFRIVMFFFGSPSLLGMLQGLVLGRFFPNAWHWIPVTLLGSLLSWVALFLAFIMGAGIADATPLNVPEAIVCGGLAGIAGFGMGFAQWMYLRQHVRRSGWWILATAIAIAIGGGSSMCSGLPFAATTDWVKQLAIGGILGGAIKGITLAWLLRQPRTLEATSADYRSGSSESGINSSALPQSIQMTYSP